MEGGLARLEKGLARLEKGLARLEKGLARLVGEKLEELVSEACLH